MYFIEKKKVGDWKDEGVCEATPGHKNCGPGGQQKQTRSCIDGRTEICTLDDRERNMRRNCQRTATATTNSLH